MKASSRVGLWLAAGVCVLLPAAIQFQNVLWSTARVENRSGRPLTDLGLLINDTSVYLGMLPAGASRFVRLPKRGDATVRVRFSAGGGDFTQCAEFMRPTLYHLRVVIEPNLLADCKAESNAFLRRNMLLEMMD